jgi:hypothetical protein
VKGYQRMLADRDDGGAMIAFLTGAQAPPAEQHA